MAPVSLVKSLSTVQLSRRRMLVRPKNQDMRPQTYSRPSRMTCFSRMGARSFWETCQINSWQTVAKVDAKRKGNGKRNDNGNCRVNTAPDGNRERPKNRK